MVDVRGDDMAQMHAVPGDEADGDEEHDSCGQDPLGAPPHASARPHVRLLRVGDEMLQRAHARSVKTAHPFAVARFVHIRV